MFDEPIPDTTGIIARDENAGSNYITKTEKQPITITITTKPVTRTREENTKNLLQRL